MIESVTTHVENDVLVITLNRPAVKNAVNADVARGLRAAIEELETDTRLTVGVITGASGTFCAGMDLKAAAAHEPVSVPGHGFAGFVQSRTTKPVIAAVEGYALGGGLEIALNCDLIVASETATFGLPEVKRGIIAGGGGVIRLPRRIPHHLAMELLLTGSTFDARRAEQLGLLNRVTGEGQALAAALELAAAISGNAPLALAAVKDVARMAGEATEDEAFARQSEVIDGLRASEDFREGADAFVQRRQPQWKGR